MATAETARLIASLELKDQFSRTADSALTKMGKLDSAVTRTSGRAYKAGTQIGTGIKNGALIAAGAIGFLATNVALGLKSLEELETVTAQTNAVLKSTKGVAGESAEAIRNLAEKYEGLNATIDDKVIQSAENVLLTFTAVRKEAFEPAILAALNMSTALGTDLQGSVIQLGKALQDPIKGITALRRVGVNFSADQIKVIKSLVETGDVLGAQKLILAELNTEFGGSFLAGGSTTAGKVARFKDSIEDLQKTLATAMLPVIGKIADALSSFLADPAVIRGAKDLGDAIAGLFSDKNLATGANFLKGAFQTAKEAAPIVAASARATFELVKGAVGLFKSLPPEIQKLAVGAFAVNKLTGGLVTNIAGGIIDTVGKQFLQRGGTPANPLFVADVTGGLGKGIPGVAAGAAAGTGLALTTAIVAPLAVAAAAKLLQDQVDTQAAGVKSTAQAFAPNATDAELAQAVDGLRKQVESMPFNTFDSKNKVIETLNVLIAEQNKRVIAGQALLAQGSQQTVRSSERLEAVFGANGDRATMDARRIEAAENRTTLAAKFVSHTISVLGAQFSKDIHGLRNATKPVDIAKFAKAIAADVAKGSGSVAGTKGVLKDLKIKLAETHDPQLQKVLRAAIHTVEAKLPNRTWVDKELALGRKIAGSNESQTRKLADLKTIEASLRAHGDRHAASTIRKLEQQITATKGVKTAALETRQAVKDKDLSVTIPITNQVAVTNGAITKVQTTYKKMSGFVS